jgi:hypothetical protein
MKNKATYNHTPKLPLMRNMDDALKVSKDLHDAFYVSAFALKDWVSALVAGIAKEYAEKSGRDRSLQSGQAKKLLGERFVDVQDWTALFLSLPRFAEHDDPHADLLSRSIVPLTYEHEIHGEYLGRKTFPKMLGLSRHARSAMAQKTVERICDWLDSIVHLQIRRVGSHAPEVLHPSPEKRDQARLALGKHFYSPDFRGDAAWLFEEVDCLVISLWPLLTKHGWTMSQLHAVVLAHISSPHDFPCTNVGDFIDYCSTALGLRTTHQISPDNNLKTLPGFVIARRMITGELPPGIPLRTR